MTVAAAWRSGAPTASTLTRYFPFPGTSIWKPGVDPLVFLTAAWPRHWTAFDLFVNVIAYVPLGFLWVPVGQRRQGGAADKDAIHRMGR